MLMFIKQQGVVFFWATICILLSLLVACGGGQTALTVDEAAQSPNLATDVRAIPNNGTLSISWINPDLDLRSLTIIYFPKNAPTVRRELTLPATALRPGQRVSSVITGLQNGVEYVVRVEAVDASDQSYNLFRVERVIGINADGDDVPDDMDNCPLAFNTDRVDSDGDGIGDACEAVGVLRLRARANNTQAVDLTWMNPPDSDLQLLNLSYGRRDGRGTVMQMNLMTVNLSAAVIAHHRVSGLTAGTSYTFTVGGVDFRHGRLNQTLPPVAVNVSTPVDDLDDDDDGILDTDDNCQFAFNPGQENNDGDSQGDACDNDDDNDGLLDSMDNCPFFNTTVQTDDDGDGIGNACEAGPVRDLRAAIRGTKAVNLTWVNPTGSVLQTLRITYAIRSRMGSDTTLDIGMMVNLTANATVAYLVPGLSSGTNYTFSLGGVDLRHGRQMQSLPLVAVNVSLPPDQDDDDIRDSVDNCPFFANTPQADADDDGIGDACVARALLDLTGRPADPSAVALRLRWTNPINSDLRALNLSYRQSDGMGGVRMRDLSGQINLTANVTVVYVLDGLMAATNYTLVLGGIDFRHGVRNQTLPLAVVNVSLPPDGDDDTIADALDNCPVHANTDQANTDGDAIGDLCEARPVMNLRGQEINTTAVNLSWTNPEDSVLVALNLQYAPRGAPGMALAIGAAVDRRAGTNVSYVLADLTSGIEYQFTVGGIDFRHGRLNQTLPLASVQVALAPDGDGDGLEDANDNCPLHANRDQGDADADDIGDDCEATSVTNLVGMVSGNSAVTVDLSWVNPAGSDLMALNITYGLSNGTGGFTAEDVTTTVDLAASARVTYQLASLLSGANYTFIVGGIDARHGRLNQVLPPIAVNVSLPSDGDDDTIADARDNCPLKANTDQANADGDAIGDACEAEALIGLRGLVIGTSAQAVNLSWVNPAASVLLVINITYGLSDGSGEQKTVNLTTGLDAGAPATYQIADLMSNTEYTFTVSGVDARHGLLNQTLPTAAINFTLPPDDDNDRIANFYDNCPLIPNAGQDDADGDAIGNVCEVRPVTDLTGLVHGSSANTVNLTWVNPAASMLVALNLTYYFRNGTGPLTVVDLSALNLSALARVGYQIQDLRAGANYTFTLGGIDARQGARNQTLPPVSINISLPADRDSDTIADRFDNCPFARNRAQTDQDGDAIGDACEAEAVLNLMGRRNGTSAVALNLSWVNPPASVLLALNITYGLSDGSGVQTTVNLTTGLDAGAQATYQIADLMSNTEYTFTVSGVDARHGMLNQTLPSAAINFTLPRDDDNDRIANFYDNCPLLANAGQDDADGDDIGDVCEARPVTDLIGLVNGSSANTVNLTWVNPAASVLVALNLTYGLSDGTGPLTVVDLSALNLSALARVGYQLSELNPATSYMLTVGGIDARQGARNQTLPPVSINISLPPDRDGDTIADRFDNCPRTINRDQTDQDDDRIGDACEAEAVLGLTGMVNGSGATAVNLSWVNPAQSDLLVLNITYGRRDRSARTTVNLTTGLTAAAPGEYQLLDLLSNTTYIFKLSGVDFRHGVFNQTVPPVTINVTLPPDTDNDTIADLFDNCPFLANRAQANADGDNIGDLCEAGPIMDLVAMVNGTSAVTVNLTWSNPRASVLLALNLSYGLSNGTGGATAIDLTALDLTAAAPVAYQVLNLTSGANYTFVLGGIDLRHGILNQTLPPAAVRLSLPRDIDGDTIADGPDNCPLVPNRGQGDQDNDGIGDACEATSVRGLMGLVNGTSAITVNLTWVNPPGSTLLGLNLSYQFSNGTGPSTTLDLTGQVDLTAAAATGYQLSVLRSNTNYTFVLGGIDLRQGVLNQTLPPVAINLTLPLDTDDDTIADRFDNCPFKANSAQRNRDGDAVGDACEAQAILGLTGTVDHPSAIAANLAWINPAASRLVALNLSYGFSNRTAAFTAVDLSGLNLTAAARMMYRVSDLLSGANYTFIISGVDFQHGVLNQTLPPRAVNVSLPRDGDNDTLADQFDNCPLNANRPQLDRDGDGVGDVCEARPVRDLVGLVNGTRAITVNLTWVNPAASQLVALNITYGFSNGTGTTSLDITNAVPLNAQARVAYQITDLTSHANYTVTIGGIDLRQGVLNQTLPPVAINVSLPSDLDDDTIADRFDNCPFKANSNQVDTDRDAIGNACEAEAVLGLAGLVNGTSAITVNLSWVNPAQSQLLALNITYGLRDGSGNVTQLNLTSPDTLAAGAGVEYQISGLLANHTYIFTVGGIDFRHGRQNQTLPPATEIVTLPTDGDNDTIADRFDNCPLLANHDQANHDGDGIGNVCEAQPLAALMGLVNGTRAITVNLSWVNPAASRLVALNITYGFSNGSGDATRVDLMADAELAPGARVAYQLSDLMANTTYTFTVGGIDLRQGVLNQTLPPVAVNVSLPPDQDHDAIADGPDNCPFKANRAQADRDGDRIGDACEAEAVLDLTGVVNGTSAITVNLTWVNPAQSQLLALTIQYGLRAGSGNVTQLNLTAASALAAAARVDYQISDLMPNHAYTFRIGGIDLRHGVLNQTLPVAEANVSLPRDDDHDTIADHLDNCPLHANTDQRDGDGDQIGDVCEARAIAGLTGIVDDPSAVAVNLSWVNPGGSDLVTLNLTYRLSDGSGHLAEVDLSALNLTAAARVTYRLGSLMSGTNYTFVIGGIDFRHGVFNQTLPSAAVNVSLPTDSDNDTIADRFDNCPRHNNTDQVDQDRDGIGNRCEAGPVTDLVGMVNGTRAITVNLTWVNPAGSDLMALNLTYGFSNGTGPSMGVDLSGLNLAASAPVQYQVSDLRAGATYTFVIGGIDFRQGARNQTLPPVAVNVSLPPDRDADTIADAFDNCPLHPNTGQADRDGDAIGDVCEAIGLANLRGMVNGTSAITVNLTWVNPAGSNLLALNLTYGFSNGTGGLTRSDLPSVNLSAGAPAAYQVSDLRAGTNYTFTLSGVDLRQGVLNQTLPPVAVNVTLPADRDDDAIADAFDNCPFKANRDQTDHDGDAIGDACEAEGLRRLVGVVNGTSAITVNLTWINPAQSVLVALNLTYGRSDGSGVRRYLNLTSVVPLAGEAEYQVTDLTSATQYTFTFSGIDARHGLVNQTIPPTSANVTLPLDGDGDTIADRFDNCPFLANTGQADRDGDSIGDVCEAKGVKDFVGVVNGTSAVTVNLTWVNPAGSDLRALNLTYGFSNGTGPLTELDLTALNLTALRPVAYQVSGLTSSSEYTFTLGGIDFRQGVLNQTLPPMAVNVTLPPDADGDTITDAFDNCPLRANQDQANMDGDAIGDACEARSLEGFIGVVNGSSAITVNLSWVNPAQSVLVALNLSYGRRDGSGVRTNVNLTALVPLEAGRGVEYQVRDLMSSSEYTFTVSGIDARHGVLNQTLPAVSVHVLLPPDADDDQIADQFDNCPFLTNTDQANADGDDIGNACEAQGVNNLVGVVNGTSAVTVNLTWVNPAASDLMALNLTYGFSNGTGSTTVVDLAALNLAAGAAGAYQVTDLRAGANYTFTLGGIDFRQGVLNQTLPPRSIVLLLPPDADSDTIADAFDNCPIKANRDQADADDDAIGNVCEAEAVLSLAGVANGTRATAVNLTWVNPAESDLVVLSLGYGPSQGGSPVRQVNLTAGPDLVRGANVAYQIAGLRSATEYTFTVGGIDLRHGMLNQTLPVVAINVSLPTDGDGDEIADLYDNCPLRRNQDQANADGDDIGDACEARGLTDLVGVVNGTSAVTVNLTWVNPTNSDLVTLNLTYGFSNGTGLVTAVDLSALDLAAGVPVAYQVTDLRAGANYTFTLSGLDVQHGVFNQTLPPVAVHVSLPLDADDDRIADVFDNCPLVTNSDQANADGDAIGDVCEARGVTGLMGMANGTRATVVNLTWVNPSASDLVSLFIDYGFSNGTGSTSRVNLTARPELASAARVEHQIANLMSNSEYTFTLGGLDLRHGVLLQALPLVAINVSLPLDRDGDTIADAADNCPFHPNQPQHNADGDDIGDACEAEGVGSFVAAPTSPTTVRLSWFNPAASNLVVLNLTYRLSDGSGAIEELDLSRMVDLGASVAVEHQVADLRPGARYTFTLSGIDIQHGVLNQTLPPRSTTASLPSDRDNDGTADASDNCPDLANPLQENADGDRLGDRCDPDDDNNGFWEIGTAEQLDTVRANVSAAYELIADIDLVGYPNWQPLGNVSHPFNGILAGRGHTIHNLSINGSEYAGLFGSILGATLRNITLRPTNVVAASARDGYVGALAGYAAESRIISATVFINGSFTPVAAFDLYLGGLAGYVRGGAIINSSVGFGPSSNFTASATTSHVGGLLGYATNSNISSSHASITVPVRVASSNVSYAGGLIGSLNDGSSLNTSYAQLSGDANMTARAGNSSYAGGLLGYAADSAMHNAYARTDGKINATATALARAGGLVGQTARGVIRHAYAWIGVLVATAADSSAGGLVGTSQGDTIINSYHHGTDIQAAQVNMDGLSRTSDQLRCPTVGLRFCAGATTYDEWDDAIWDLGTVNQLPVLRRE